MFGGFDNIFHVYLIEEIEFSRWLFEDRPRQGENVLPDGLNWLCYLQVAQKAIMRIAYFWNPLIK